MDKTKIQFKALRESLGITAKDIAEAVNVKQTTVLAWDNNKRTDIRPSQAGWDFLAKVAAEQSKIGTRALNELYGFAESHGLTLEDVTLVLVYYRNQKDYEEDGHSGSYAVHNATMRALLNYVSECGGEVQFIERSVGGNYDVTGIDNPVLFLT